MVRAYSMDLRERVLVAVASGEPVRSVARRFGVSPSFVSKLHTRYRRSGSVAADRQGGDRRSHRIEAHAEWLEKRLREAPDTTLSEFCDGLKGRGLATVPSTVWRFFDRRGLTYKKRQPMPASRSGPM